MFEENGEKRFDLMRSFEGMSKKILNNFYDSSNFKMDVKNSNKEYSIEADLPGVKKEDINVDISSGYLRISAERRNEHEERDIKEGLVHVERSYGSFSRKMRIPDSVDINKIKAKYENGVLKLTLPKTAKAISSTKKLEIE